VKRTLFTTAVVLACAWPIAAGAAQINLEWRSLSQTVLPGQTAPVGLYAVASGASSVGFSSAQLVIDWNPAYVQLLNNSSVGAVDLMGSSFLPGDSFGLNESNPPTDGDGMWVGMVMFGQERFATSAGTLLTTLNFRALAPTGAGGTLINMLTDSTVHPKPARPAALSKVINLQSESVLGSLGGPAGDCYPA
jgi:hypothetical protein